MVLIQLDVCIQKNAKDTYLSPCTKLKYKWIKDLNIKPDTLNLMEEKVAKNLRKLKSFCRAKDTFKMTK